MKVNRPQRPVALDAVRATRANGTSKSDDTKSAPAGERVQVSNEAKLLMEARAPEVPDQDRIARLKEAIANGTFEVDADRIADAMLNEEL